MTPSPSSPRLAGTIDSARRHGDLAVGLRDRAILALLEAGVRASEISGLRRAHLQVQRGTGRFEVTVKRGPWRCSQVLDQVTTRYLIEWLEASRTWDLDAMLFPGRDGGSISNRTISVLVLRYRIRAGRKQRRRRSA